MGYRVDYQPVKKVRGLGKRTARAPALAALFLILFCLLVNSVWPRGAEMLRELLIPGDAAVTVAALEAFTTELEAGETLSGALEGFCRKVIQEAALDPN